MLTIRMVAEALRVTEKDIWRATRQLGNVGRTTQRQGTVYSSADIDLIKEFLHAEALDDEAILWKRAELKHWLETHKSGTASHQMVDRWLGVIERLIRLRPLTLKGD